MTLSQWNFVTFNFLLMHRVGYRAVKSPICVKKSQIDHNFFVTKATDLKSLFLKSPWKMDVETRVTLWYLFKTKKYFLQFLTNFRHFFKLHSFLRIKTPDLETRTTNLFYRFIFPSKTDSKSENFSSPNTQTQNYTKV